MEEKFEVLNELGEFTGEIATREECYKKGLWHRAVYAFIIDDDGNVLLQKRSRLWPNMCDVTVGGHVDSGEFGRQALVKEVKEELLERISNNYNGLTQKTGPWNFLEKILNNYVK